MTDSCLIFTERKKIWEVVSQKGMNTKSQIKKKGVFYFKISQF